MSTPTKELAPSIQKTITPIVTTAASITITTPAHMKDATELLSLVNKNIDRIEAEREKVTKPLNAALKAENARWKPMRTSLESARDTIREKMSEYQTAQKARTDAEAAAIAARIKPGKGNLSPETGVQKIASLDTPSSSVAADSGSVTFITVKHFEVVNILELAKNAAATAYLLPNEPAIRKAMLAGIPLAGVRYYETQEPRNSR